MPLNRSQIRTYGNYIVGILSLLLIVSCTSRYRLDLFVTQFGDRMKADVERTEYVVQGVLNAPLSTAKVVSGAGNVIILHTGSRHKTAKEQKSRVLKDKEP